MVNCIDAREDSMTSMSVMRFEILGLLAGIRCLAVQSRSISPLRISPNLPSSPRPTWDILSRSLASNSLRSWTPNIDFATTVRSYYSISIDYSRLFAILYLTKSLAVAKPLALRLFLPPKKIRKEWATSDFSGINYHWNHCCALFLTRRDRLPVTSKRYDNRRFRRLARSRWGISHRLKSKYV